MEHPSGHKRLAWWHRETLFPSSLSRGLLPLTEPMHTLREKLTQPSFLVGVELLSTRASMSTEQGARARELAGELAATRTVDWVSITDNAGGNPTLSPQALGKPLLYAGKEVIIHLSCKDFNRNGLESVAWQLASEGFHNVLALSGDYPVNAYGGGAKPVFDLDAVGLLTMLREMDNVHPSDHQKHPGATTPARSNPTPPLEVSNTMAERPFHLIGELINHSFARARRAWDSRDVEGYRRLATLQEDLGADYLTLNLDGTQTVRIRKEEMLDFLPCLLPALQESTSVPMAFDNPGIEFHRKALELYDRSRSGPPILNSVAASREHLDEMIELVEHYDTLVVIMASEKFVGKDSAQCLTAEDVYQSARHFVEQLATKAGRRNDQIIIDPGLAPVAADTYGLVNISLDAMRLIRQDPDLEGVHISVGLTNFSFGVPKTLRTPLEKAYVTLGLRAGLDFVLGSPEKNLDALNDSDPVLLGVLAALEAGRPQNGTTQEEAGFCQAEKIMELFPR